MKHLLFFLLLPAFTMAQPTASCYNDLRNKGLEYMAAKDFGEAISQFVAALVTCKEVPADNDISRKIEESKKKWAAALQASVTEAQKAYHDALEAQKKAESAQNAESEARKIAEDNARRAYQRGVRAESYRLALLADMARQQNQKTDALMLSWMGLQLSDTLQPFIMRAFGDAVRDSFARTVFTSQQEILSVSYFDQGKKLLIRTALPAWFVLSVAETGQVAELPGSFTQITPSPDGELLLACGNATTATILSPGGKTEAVLKGHLEAIRQAAWSPDSKYVVTCARDNTARIWSRNGALVATLTGHTANVQEASFSPDGSLVLTRSTDGTARLWSLDGSIKSTFSEADGMVQAALISSANVVFVQYNTNKTDIRDQQGNLLNSFKTAALYHPKFNINGAHNRIAVQVGASEIQVFDQKGTLQADITLKSAVAGCSLSDGGQLLAWTKEGDISLWGKDGKLLQKYTGHRKRPFSALYAESKNLVLSTALDGNARLWDQAGNVLSEWKTAEKWQIPSMFSPSGTEVCILGDNGKSVLISPVPLEILEHADRKALLASAAADKVKMVYGIQFWEMLQR